MKKERENLHPPPPPPKKKKKKKNGSKLMAGWLAASLGILDPTGFWSKFYVLNEEEIIFSTFFGFLRAVLLPVAIVEAIPIFFYLLIRDYADPTNRLDCLV